MSLSLVIQIVGAVWFLYAFLYKPQWVAILLFVTIIADINFDLKGIPLNFRSFVTLLLFIKTLTDSKRITGPSFMSVPYSRHIIIFVIYLLAVTYANGLLEVSVAKEFCFAILYAYLGYYYYMKEGSYQIFRISIILAGFSCLGDLVWTYMQGYELRVERLYFLFTPSYTVFNHNFFGYICSVAFVFLLADYLSEHGKKWNLFLMPCMFMGVLLSTSRSSMLILIIVSIFLIIKGLASNKNAKKAYRLVMVTVSCIVLALFMFQLLTIVFHINSEFIETITKRLIDEPVAIINRALGNEFKAESLDSMDWRAKASEVAYNDFMNVLQPDEQLFGIGHEGFMARNLGDEGYDAHNGILLMLIELGIVGFIIYYSMLISLMVRYLRLKLFSPLLVCLVFIILFITSHNRELIAGFVFLLTGSMAAELEYQNYRVYELEEEEEPMQISGEYLET